MHSSPDECRVCGAHPVVLRPLALRHFGLTFAALLALAGGPSKPARAEDASALRLIPFPKEVALEAGELRLDSPLVLEGRPEATAAVTAMVSGELTLAGLPKPDVAALGGSESEVRIRPAARARGASQAPAEPGDDHGPEAYVLTVSPGGVAIRGAGPEGLLHGVKTFCQLIRANRRGAALPCLRIRDWPSLRWRAFQDDITRGPSSKLEELQLEVRLGAMLKMNVFTYYMQSQFAFKKHPVIGPADGSLAAEELKALVEFARPLGVEILGNQQSFAHLQDIVKHDRYADLREDGRTLSPVNEGSYRLLDDLYSEVLPLLPFEFFNVCCDETFNLGSGPSKDLASQIGVGGVYVRHILRVHDLVHRKYGKRMMMWGDIILQHPDKLGDLPKDIVMLTWGYDSRPSFEDQIAPFAKSGFQFFVCPGVNCWSRVLPDFEASVVNIQNFVRDGAKHGAIGMLNTSWDDDGESLNAPSWHGFAWGAECAWNASTTRIEDFNRRLGAVLFGEKESRFGRAIELLATRQPRGPGGLFNHVFWQDDFAPIQVLDVEAEKARCEAWLASVRRAIGELEACRAEAIANAELIDAFVFGARRLELFRQRRIDRLEAACNYREAAALPAAKAVAKVREAEGAVRRTRSSYESLRKRWQELWLRENRPYALDWSLARYDEALKKYGALLARLDGARELAEKGEALPSAAEMGLEIVELGRRSLEPRRLDPAPMDPRTPWADPTATHRIGLLVQPCGFGRADFPLELELRLPEPLGSRPVRAFREDCGTGSASGPVTLREILAQLDRGEGQGRHHLSLLVAGSVARDEAARIRVYFGLERPPAPLSGSVGTSDGPDGTKWIESDRLRLLLSPIGGHIYRWEVKALGGLDLTLDGETDYAGFSDLGGARRAAAGNLVCTAQGPALVRHVWTDAEGFSKTVSVFGGVPWVDVLLSEGVSYYWDFDDPRHFSADAPAPGRYLFSDGAAGPVGKEADGPGSQAAAPQATWAAKLRGDGLFLALVSPDAAGNFKVGPGGGWGGVGIEASPSVQHFVTWGGVLEGDLSGEIKGHCESLRQGLSLIRPAQVVLHALEARP